MPDKQISLLDIVEQKGHSPRAQHSGVSSEQESRMVAMSSNNNREFASDTFIDDPDVPPLI